MGWSEQTPLTHVPVSQSPSSERLDLLAGAVVSLGFQYLCFVKHF